MKFRILIADDEELERRALKFIISGMEGFDLEIAEAANGRQAVEEVQSGPVDLALLDVRMPGMDGITAAKAIRSLDPETRVVFVTAFDSFEYAREALRLGVDEYLLKPADRETVRATVTRVLDSLSARRLERENQKKAGTERELAVMLLRKELHGALERNSLIGERVEAFLELLGIRAVDRIIAVARQSPGSGDMKIKTARSRRLAQIAEITFRDLGWFGLAAADGEEIRMIAVAGPDTEAERLHVLERLVAAARDTVGYRILVGAVPWIPGEGADLFSPALDALALAHQKQPIIYLAPGYGETAGERPYGGDRAGVIINRALEFIKGHLSENLTLADVAAVADCSSWYLSHLFRSYSGDTFIRTIMKSRLDAAKSLLRTGKYSVKEVAALVGFHDQTYFARIFKRMENRSPGEYRTDPDGG